MKTALFSAALLSTVVSFVSAAHASTPASAHLFPREAAPLGGTYEDWSAQWWQWAQSIPVDENPILGGDCGTDQPGDVFFLAGNAGGVESRSCAVPVGKAIFFPLLNSSLGLCPEFAGDSFTCEAAMSEQRLDDSASWIEGLDADLILEIDGVSVNGLEEYRARSEYFQSDTPDTMADRFCSCSGEILDNPCGVPVGSQRTILSTGYWAMLRPLSPGHHHLRFGGTWHFDGGEFMTDVTYDLVVAH